MAEPSPPLTIHQAHPHRQVDEAALTKLVHHVVEQEARSLRALSLVLTDHETVLRLNRDYLGHDYYTDVLSFDFAEDDEHAIDGEIYIDLDTAAERHEEFSASFEDEVYRYVVHGMLHLIGYDDTSPDEQATMRAREDQYLRILS